MATFAIVLIIFETNYSTSYKRTHPYKRTNPYRQNGPESMVGSNDWWSVNARGSINKGLWEVGRSKHPSPNTRYQFEFEYTGLQLTIYEKASGSQHR